MTQHQHHVVSAGIRDFLCGAMALIITISVSSGFLRSSGSIQWMGSETLDPVGVVTVVSIRYGPQ